jgi:ABC-2 type transport system ATP-binding protein
MIDYRPMPSAPSIVVDKLRIRRGGVIVLDDLSLAVASGRVTGLLGPSGSGKTTLMRAIVGVQIVESGTIAVLGEPAGTPPLRWKVGYMTQNAAVYGDLTVRENLRYFARILDAAPESVDEVLETVAMTSFAGRVVNKLSGGQRARVSLATALIGSPELLVLDEPTVGLDPVLRRDLWKTFNELAEQGKTLLVSSHVMDEADHCHDLLLLREGKLVATGSPADVRAQSGKQDLDEAFLVLINEEVE